MFTLSSCPSCSNGELRYPPDKSAQLVFPQCSGSIGFPNTYPLDSDLSGTWIALHYFFP